MTVDTALFVMAAGETKEESTLVGFTESKDKDVCVEICVHLRICSCSIFPLMLTLGVCVLVETHLYQTVTPDESVLCPLTSRPKGRSIAGTMKLKLDCATCQEALVVFNVVGCYSIFVPAEICLERRIACWDLLPAALHEWMQTKEEEQKEPVK